MGFVRKGDRVCLIGLGERSRLVCGGAIAIHSILGVISCAPCITASTSICSGLM
ncbi:MAG: hypothetical protein V7K26_20515 [Nostoc sp.]|uniref:hypothetical protein n=1 Tax=Nostoc sp. TaxID=1180 RepID=UPI002FF15B94